MADVTLIDRWLMHDAFGVASGARDGAESLYLSALVCVFSLYVWTSPPYPSKAPADAFGVASGAVTALRVCSYQHVIFMSVPVRLYTPPTPASAQQRLLPGYESDLEPSWHIA